MYKTSYYLPITYYRTFSGKRHCSMNIHLLRHITDCVKKWGPLWAYSCFQFEGANNNLKKLFHGTKNMSEQVGSHFTCCRKGHMLCTPLNLINLEAGKVPGLDLWMLCTTDGHNLHHESSCAFILWCSVDTSGTHFKYSVWIQKVNSQSHHSFF